MSGMCKPNVQEKSASEPLSTAQFLSAFLLLGIGTLVSLGFLILEHLYMKYLQDHVDRKNETTKGCFSLLSQSIGQSYSRSEYTRRFRDRQNSESSFQRITTLSSLNSKSVEEIPQPKSGTLLMKAIKSRPPSRHCQDRGICDAKLFRLSSELAEARRQILKLESALKHQQDQEDNVDLKMEVMSTTWHPLAKECDPSPIIDRVSCFNHVDKHFHDDDGWFKPEGDYCFDWDGDDSTSKQRSLQEDDDEEVFDLVLR